jgi:hypothetical protein
MRNVQDESKGHGAHQHELVDIRMELWASAAPTVWCVMIIRRITTTQAQGLGGKIGNLRLESAVQVS